MTDLSALSDDELAHRAGSGIVVKRELFDELLRRLTEQRAISEWLAENGDFSYLGCGNEDMVLEAAQKAVHDD